MRRLAILTISSLLGRTLAVPLCGLVEPSSLSSAGSGDSCLFTRESDSYIAATWYAGWDSAKFPLSNVSWDKYTHVIYSFALTTDDGSMASLESSDAANIPDFVSMAHENNVKAILSVGGWGGSRFYSSNVADDNNRTTFATALLDLVSKYDLDGLDFDWEYPNGDGIGCNVKNPMDASNFLSFLQTIRADPKGSNLTLSAATSIKPFNGQDGTPLSDVSQFANVLDFISIMNYDIWGSWSTSAGPNAPLNDTCAPSADQQGSAVSAVAAWTGAGFPASKISLGVASYGHSFSVSQADALNKTADSTSLNLYPAFDKSKQPAGDAWDSVPGETDSCGNPTVVGGIFDFWGLISGGFLSSNGTVADGIIYAYDDCSQTPFVYNPTSQVMVAYDDAKSFSAKGQFIADNKLAGFSMWQAGGDSGDILLDAIRGAIGGYTTPSSGRC